MRRNAISGIDLLSVLSGACFMHSGVFIQGEISLNTYECASCYGKIFTELGWDIFLVELFYLNKSYIFDDSKM